MKYQDVSDIIPNEGLTHAGVFHADDVFATALLKTLNPQIEIIRSNVVAKDFDGIVYDVGGAEFDHHKSSVPTRQNGVPYSSFGLIWNKFGHLVLHEEGAARFDEEFVQPIDLADNTGIANPLSQCVSDFNPREIGASQLAYDRAFVDAVEWACGILERRFASLRGEDESREFVREAMLEGDGTVLVLERLVPWKSVLVGSGYVYVVYPSLRGGYNVQCVPERLGDGSMVRSFPEAWRGLIDKDLVEATGVTGATFCHTSGFLCVADTLDAALMMARASIDMGGLAESS